MKTFKELFLTVVLISIFASFTKFENPEIVLVKTNETLENNQFKLQEGTILLNSTKFENLYVTITSKRITGKEWNENNKRERRKGTQYNIKFYEKCNQTGKTLQKAKTFITVFDSGRIDKWNTEKPFEVDNYKYEIKVVK